MSISNSGLTAQEAAARLQQNGPNELPEAKHRSPATMLFDQFRDPMIVLLLAAALISGVIGELHDAVAIIIIVLLNSLIGFIQEFRAEKALAALKAMAAPWATVIRDQMVKKIPARELVIDDLVLIEAGQIIPADIRLVETAVLKIDESALTGESVPVEKSSQPPDPQILAHAALGDMRHMAFKGTIATFGRGTGTVVATGLKTEMGRIATLLTEADELKTPMQRRMARMGRNLAIAALLICAVVFVSGLLRGEELMRMLLTAVSLAVAAVPEALPAVVTISLALGAKQMVRRQALIRKLPAVETLGSVSTICTDKTGTLTMNRMTVECLLDDRLREISPLADLEPDNPLLLNLALNNDVRAENNGGLVGDPTETALYMKAKEFGFTKEELLANYPRVAEIPFSSERQAMTTIHRNPTGGYLALVKGGFEAVTAKCVQSPATAESEHRQLAASGLRVLAFGMREFKELPTQISAATVETELIFLGLTGSMDPPRPEAAEAVKTCKAAGIRPIMITGDHPLTAKTIAIRIGILDPDTPSEVCSGITLAAMRPEELAAREQDIQVYARVAPEQKLHLVAALQAKNQAVAMTGDGVNDAPALKQADIGVAMGINGTDVAKEAADMVLLDDNFATIVRAVREGRKIYDNIRKFFRYTLTSNGGEIWTIFLAPFLGLPIPLLPIHILWINLVTDGLPGLALTVEPAEPDIMQRPPRPLNESMFSHGMWQHIIFVGLLMGGLCLAVQAWALATGRHWQTMVFSVLCLSQLGHVMAIRSEKQSIFTLGLFSNPFMLLTVIGSIGLQLATVYVPFLQPVFYTQPLDPTELIVVLAVSTLVFWAVELEKWLKRHRRRDLRT